MSKKAMMTANLVRLPAVAVAVAVAAGLAVAGCGGGSSSDYYPPPQATTAVQPVPSAHPEPGGADELAPPAPVQPARPEGSVPEAVLGTWVGGYAGRSDFTFVAVPQGEYQLEHVATPALPAFIESGWIVGDADELLLRPFQIQGSIETGERIASWYSLPNSAGVEMLVIVDPLFGELTYVRGNV